MEEEVTCPSCESIDFDVAEIPGPLFRCGDCGTLFDPPDLARTELPPCQVSGRDGNAFAVIARVRRCLRQAGQKERAEAWVADAMASESYDELLGKIWSYVDAR